jgi:hypothetical protein
VAGIDVILSLSLSLSLGHRGEIDVMMLETQMYMDMETQMVYH